MTTTNPTPTDLPEALRLANALAYCDSSVASRAAAELRRLHSAISAAATPLAPFQQRVQPWMMECFGPMIAGDWQERNHRFLEEALELVQATGCTSSEAHQLVDYVYGRPVGEPVQEVGGVMVTLAALCLANGLDMHTAAETELARIWTKVEAIRAKQAAKPKHSPLPEAAAPQPPAALPGGQDSRLPQGAEAVGDDGWPKLTAEAKTAGPTFGKGVSARLLVESCYRRAAMETERRTMTPDAMRDEERRRRALWDMVHGPLDAAMAAKGRTDGGAA